MTTEYPAISLWQPWASLLFAKQPDGSAVKVHETRNRPAPLKYVGRRIAIHAARQPINRRNLPPALQDLCVLHFGEDFARTLPMGEFIGTALLESSAMISPTGPRPVSPEDALCGYWDRGRWAWRLAEPRLLPVTVITQGFQGWWTVRLEAA